MARSARKDGKLLAALVIGAAIVGMNFMRNRRTLRPISDELAGMAKQGVDNVRQDWSDRVETATGGVVDLKGKPFWTSAGLVLASTLISACVDEARKQSEKRAEKANRPARPPALSYEEWLATKPSPDIVRPGPMPHVSYEPSTIGERWGRASVVGHYVTDPATGDVFSIPYTYGRSPHMFTLSNKREARVIVEGTYRSHSFKDGDLLVFEITSAKTRGKEEPEFDATKIARFFRAYIDAGLTYERSQHPNYPRSRPPEVQMIDSRADFTEADIDAEYR